MKMGKVSKVLILFTLWFTPYFPVSYYIEDKGQVIKFISLFQLIADDINNGTQWTAFSKTEAIVLGYIGGLVLTLTMVWIIAGVFKFLKFLKKTIDRK